jgi:nicotinamide-nucleotide amidase
MRGLLRRERGATRAALVEGQRICYILPSKPVSIHWADRKERTMSDLTAAVLLIGDELLSGDIADRNGPYLAERLTDYGFRVRNLNILPDETDQIAAGLTRAAEGQGLVVLCGGLGPTSDDRTSEAVAKALGLTLTLDREQWERIREIFSVFRAEEPPPGNEKQAMIPAGAEILPNELGTAPGYVMRTGRSVVAVLPGPPRENRPMVEKELLPWLDRNLPGRDPKAVTIFRVFGLAESEVGHRLRPLEAAFPELSFGYRFSFPEILVKLRGKGAEGGEVISRAGPEVSRVLAPHVYATGDRNLAAVLGQELVERGLRVVTAESCTGGLSAKLLTDTPGSSAWMERGFVTYSNASKQELLGVPAFLLERDGAVSEAVARAMLEGALGHSAADVGFAITGVAGPDGGTNEKPVGTVCVAWGDRKTRTAATYRFHWDRECNRLISAWAAMRQLHLHVISS